MATQYSDNLASTVAGPYNSNYRRDGSLTSARLRKKRMLFTGVGVLPVSEELRMGTFRSSDRLFDLRLSTSSAAPSTGLVNIGLYKAGVEHDGVGIDADLFASVVAVTTVLSRTDVLVESTTIASYRRGLHLWEMADLAGGVTYETDPREDWDIVISVSTEVNAAQTFLLEADFVSIG